MAVILIISANNNCDPYPVYPLGASIVSSALQQAGHSVHFFDVIVHRLDTLAEVIMNVRPQYVGLAMRNVDNVTYTAHQSQLSHYQQICSIVRRHSDALLILGGTAFTIFPQLYLQSLGADYGITGPGEHSLPALIADLEQKRMPASAIIAGITADSASVRFHQRSNALSSYYLAQGGMLNVQTKKGCPYGCIYCSYPDIEGSRFVFRDPKEIIDELQYLKQQHACDFVFFTDSVFNDPRQVFLTIAEEMIRADIRMHWTCYMRPAHFTDNDMALLKRAGLHSIEWGSDCATDTTLNAMGKGFTWDIVRTANKLAAKHGIPSGYFIMFGGPGETYETVKQGFANLTQLEHAVLFAGIGVRIFPRTGIYTLALDETIITGTDDLLQNEKYYFSSSIDPQQLDSLVREEFSQHRGWMYPMINFAERNVIMRQFGVRGPLWDQLLPGKR